MKIFVKSHIIACVVFYCECKSILSFPSPLQLASRLEVLNNLQPLLIQAGLELQIRNCGISNSCCLGSLFPDQQCEPSKG